jgi:hypothetical protein
MKQPKTLPIKKATPLVVASGDLLGGTSRRYKCALCGAKGRHSKNGRNNPPICGQCRNTKGIGAAGVMLQIFEAGIITGVWPQKGSPCHKLLRAIISVAAPPNDQALPQGGAKKGNDEH